VRTEDGKCNRFISLFLIRVFSVEFKLKRRRKMDLDEIQDITKNVIHSETKYELISFPCSNGMLIAKNNSGKSGVIPYKKWRVVAVGFVVTTGGVSTEDPTITFGSSYGDIGAVTKRYGQVKQDVTGNKEFDAHDVYIKDPTGVLGTASALGGAGTPVWTAEGAKLGVWETAANVLQIGRANDHTLTIVGFMLLEVQIR